VPFSPDPFPVAAVGEFGKGRVVYFAAGIDAAFFSYGFPYQRIVLSRAVQWAAGEKYPIEVKAPMCVQSTFWKQDESKTIVHFWNGLNTSSDHGQQDVEAPLREESIAIHGIQLRVQGIDFKTAHAQPSGIRLETTISGGVTTIHVPPLEVHTAVVIE
jgi:hypothetical protein